MGISLAPLLGTDRDPRRENTDPRIRDRDDDADVLPHTEVDCQISLAVRPLSESAAAHRFVVDVELADIAPRSSSALRTGSWRSEVLHQLMALTELSENWDGYGAPSIQPATVISALMFLEMIAAPTIMTPAIVATGLGHVQLEWHGPEGELDVEITPEGSYEGIYEGPLGDREWSGNLDKGVDPDLAKGIARLGSAARR
jgi:hypothetical protein